jgi:hypothetical protein
VQHQLEVLQRIVNPKLNIEIGHLGSVDESGKRLSEGIVRFNSGLSRGSTRRNTRAPCDNGISPLIRRLGSEDPEGRARDEMALKVEGACTAPCTRGIGGARRGNRACGPAWFCRRAAPRMLAPAWGRKPACLPASCVCINVTLSSAPRIPAYPVSRSSPIRQAFEMEYYPASLHSA